MQSWNSPRENAFHNVRGALAKLTARDIELPAAVTSAVAVLDRVESGQPTEPPHDAIRRAILQGADRDEINTLALDELAYSRIAAEHRQANIDAACAVMAAIRAAHDTIHPQLATLAHNAIEHLTAVSELPSQDVMQLVRDGDHRGAQLLAEVDVVAGELEVLFDMRDDLISGGLEQMRLNHVDCSRFRDSETLGIGATAAEKFLDALRLGNEIWFPTKQEAIEAAKPAFERDQAKADENAAIRRAQNAASQAFAR